MPARIPSPLAPRAVAALASGIGAFVLCLAWLGPLGGSMGAGVIVVAALAALGLPAVIARCTSVRAALVATAACSLGAGAVIGLAVLLAWSHGWDLRGVSMSLPLTIWVVAGLLRAAGYAPIALVLRRGAALHTRDAVDRAMLAAAAWLVVALVESVAVLYFSHGGYGGPAAPLLGPGLLALLGLGTLTAFAALVRGVRCLHLWRSVRRGAGWRAVPASRWDRSPPDAVWFHTPGAEPDAVLVRTVTRDAVAYREGDLELAVARVPSNMAPVTRTLAWRVGAACALLAMLGALAMGPLATLRW